MIRGRVVEVGRRELLDGSEADVIVITVASTDDLRLLAGRLYGDVEISTEIDLRQEAAPAPEACTGELDTAASAAQDTHYARRP